VAVPVSICENAVTDSAAIIGKNKSRPFQVARRNLREKQLLDRSTKIPILSGNGLGRASGT